MQMNHLTMHTDNAIDDRRFLFSVVMPVYNVEEYLAEAIESLVGQSIGFRENIQLILVNDGSTDGSGDICRKYRDMYPDNIIYIMQNNAGVSNARNSGMYYIRGTYVNFMDSDDVWDRDAFEHARKFFSEHSDIGIATGRMLYMDMPGSWHHLDYMFDYTKVIDIRKNYVCPVYSAAKTFIRTDLIGDLVYDERIQIAEDALFVNKLILQQGRFGVLREAVYYYRKRADQSSALDNATRNLSYYLDTPQYVYLGLADYSVELFGEVIPYIQYFLITDLQWRIRSKQGVGALSEENRNEYYRLLTECLQAVDDRIIFRQRRMSPAQKAYAIRMKYEGDESKVPEKTKKMQEKDLPLYIYRITSDNDSITITGRAFEKYAGSDYRIIAKDQKGNVYESEYPDYPAYDVRGVSDDIVLKGYIHSLRLPAAAGCKYRFYMVSDDGYKRKLDIQNVRYSRFTDRENTFFAGSGHLCKLIEDRLCVYDYSLRTYAASAKRYNEVIRSDADSDISAIRNHIITKKVLPGRPVILIESEAQPRKANEAAAENTGMGLYRCMITNNAFSKYKICIAADQETLDHAAASERKGILLKDSDKHKIMHALAGIVIAADDAGRYLEPYGKKLEYFRDLLDYKYVVLRCTKPGSHELPQARDGLRIDHTIVYDDSMDCHSVCEELISVL